MIDVKTAVRKAIDYVREFEDYLPQGDIRLEETEFLDHDIWLITLSLSDGAPFAGRIYKEFRIDGETGAVLAMKVRSLAGAK